MTMSHALLDAWDRNDDDAFTPRIGAAFEMLDERDLRSRTDVIGLLRARKARHAPSRSRTSKDEHVSIGEASAVFVGESVEHFPPDSDRPTGDFDGYNTLVWVREAGVWKLAYWQWVKGGLDAERAQWNEMYGAGRAFNPEPSKFLAEMVKGRKPGTALDYLMGQGRNSIYLASLGWTVTGVDISKVGLSQARAAADARKLHIEAIEADATTWDFGADKWDLVVMTYAGCCDARTMDQLRKSMKRGGLLVAEGFAGGQDERRARFADGFTVVHDAVVEDLADWGSSAGRPAVPQTLSSGPCRRSTPPTTTPMATYTFVIRHEDTVASTAPCLSGSGTNSADTIMSGYPYTLLIAGHTHTYQYYATNAATACSRFSSGVGRATPTADEGNRRHSSKGEERGDRKPLATGGVAAAAAVLRRSRGAGARVVGV